MTLSRLASVLVAVASIVAGAALAINHPLWPMGMLIMLWCVVVLEMSMPGAWLLLVPGCLPFMNFSPWTGWIVFDELDIVLLAVLASGYARSVFAFGGAGVDAGTGWSKSQTVGCALTVTGAAALMRGVADAGGWSFDWFAGYTHAMNSVRVFKSLGFAVLLWPLLSQQMKEDSARAQRRFAWGIVLGLTCVSLSVLWERAGFVGLWNFSANYRTVALFWEMHVGGAAIDAYLAIAAPFAVWPLVAAKRPASWAAAAVLVLLVGYACLTTFSRGVYLAVISALLLLAYLVHRRNHLARVTKVRWRMVGGFVLMTLLSMEILAVLGGDSFMHKRIAKSDQDMGSRIDHWRHGVELLNGPDDWLLGKGLGRMPANYSANVEGENFSGEVSLAEENEGDGKINRFAVLVTPPNWDELPGVYALSQRVDSTTNIPLHVSMDVRVQEPVDITVQLCQRHLLYDRNCQGATVHVDPHAFAWQTVEVPLSGPPLIFNTRGPSRLVMFVVSLDTPGGTTDIDNLKLTSAIGQQMLANGDFSRRLSQWLPVAQGYYVPWHIDNLYLELLIERGLLGLLVVGAFIAWALTSTLWSQTYANPLHPYLAAGLFGSLVVGLVSSVLDVPRVALIFHLLPMMLIGCKNRPSKVIVNDQKRLKAGLIAKTSGPTQGH